MKNVSLVLSSGGARGLAHIGAIEELERRGYTIRSISGCSMGALVGGMYAAGRLQEFKEWMRTVDKRKIVSLIDLSLSINHIVKGEKIIEALKEVVPDVLIEDLPIPYCAVASDWENGREVVFRSGSLYEAIRASISIPLFFNPIQRDDMVLMNIADRLLPSGTDINYVTLISRMCSLMIQRNAALSIRLFKPDVLVDIPMNRFGSFEYDKYEKISRLGQSKMRKALDEYESQI